jgi:phosphoglycolate phosphatase
MYDERNIIPRMITDIAFDFDGVLADSFAFHVREINAYFPGLNMTEVEFRSMHDGNFYASQPERFSQIDWEGYAQWVSEKEGKLPINTELQTYLHDYAKEYRLHIISSGFEVQIRPFLESHGLTHLFTSMQFRHSAPNKHAMFEQLIAGEGITPETLVYVTDTTGDIQEAGKVGVRCIGVTFGFHERARLTQAAPEILIDSWQEFPQAVAALSP